MDECEMAGRRAAMEELKGLGRHVRANRLISAVRKPAAAPAETAPEAPGESLMDRIRRLKG